jgi:hypothetical protein
MHHSERTSKEFWRSYVRKFVKIKLKPLLFSCSEEVYHEKALLLGTELGELEPYPCLRFI